MDTATSPTNAKGRRRGNGRRGFSLAELLVSTAILILATTGILISYLRCLELSEISKNSSLAIRAARSQMEQIKSTAFDQIPANFNGVSFAVTDLNGRGVCYVTVVTPEILRVTVSVSWKLKNGRVYGEDNNLNGVINMGEDANANGVLNSPVEMVMNILER